MKLTRYERWLLANQYRILEKLDPGQADSYRAAQEVLESGYEAEYSGLCPHIYDDRDTLSADQCSEVIDILQMHRALHDSYGSLQDKAGIKENDTRFWGFDGNNETTYMAYAKFFCDGDPSSPRYTELDRSHRFNSHMPTLWRYRPMLRAWQDFDEPHMMSKAQLEAVLAAGRAKD